MTRPASYVFLVSIAALTLAAAPTPAATSESAARVAAPVAVTADPAPGAGDPRLILAIAQRCLEGPHAALVGNAMRQGRVFDPAEALRWCS